MGREKQKVQKESDVILINTWLAITSFEDPCVCMSSPSQQCGLCGQIRSKTGVQRKPGREPEMELSCLRCDLSLSVHVLLVHPALDTVQESLFD